MRPSDQELAPPSFFILHLQPWSLCDNYLLLLLIDFELFQKLQISVDLEGEKKVYLVKETPSRNVAEMVSQSDAETQ